MVAEDKGARDGYIRFGYCGGVDSDVPRKVRALRALKTERWPKSADAK
jgi:hypothetical protein